MNENDMKVFSFSAVGFLQNHLINFPTYLNITISILTIVYLIQKIIQNEKNKNKT